MTKDDLVSKDTALNIAIEFMGTLTIDVGIKTWNEKHRKEAIQACKEALEQQDEYVFICKRCGDDLGIKYVEHPAQEPKCSEHPDAPHGFCRNASHSAGRYVCECEGWEAEQPTQDFFERGKEIAKWADKQNEQPAQEPVAWMKNALDNARDVCKYLDHDMIKEAKAHTKFFWNDLDKIRDFDDNHPAQEPECSNHPDAPHGFCRNASHSAGRYVCECEGWEAEQQSQEPVAWGNPTYNYAVHHKVAPSWQGLSDDDITKAVLEIPATFPSIFGIARAIEQALRNKNGY